MSTLAYPDNIGLLRVTKVGSRYVTLATGIILLVRGGLQPFDRLLQAVPLPVLAAGTVLLIVMKAALSLRATDKAKAELRNLPSG
jgi:xanthine/uracil permease